MPKSITDYLTGKKLRDTPEEAVRQDFEHRIVEYYGYVKAQCDIEVSIQLGANRWDRADIVIYTDDSKTREWVIIETKRPNRTDGVSQLKIYMNATGAPLGVWTNGLDEVYLYREEPNVFIDIADLAKKGQPIEDVGSELRRRDLVPATDLQGDFQGWEDYILAHQGVDVFNELFKLIYAKLYDENVNLVEDDSECQFRARPGEDDAQVKRRISTLFANAVEKWGVFEKGEHIELRDDLLANIVRRLQRYYLWKTDLDVLGTGFEFLVASTMKGEKGQYFTPRQVIRMMVDMIGVHKDCLIVDPAVGSGGFLIYCIGKVWHQIESAETDERRIGKLQVDFAAHNVFGIDYESRMVKIAKAHMLIWGDGRAHIYLLDSLRDYGWDPIAAKEMQPDSFDVVVTNPPFAGDLKDPDVLNRFELAHKKGKSLRSQSRHILFIEMCLKYLKPGGKMGIVLPIGVLNNPTLKYVRDWINDRALILAAISLDRYIFAPHTGNRAGVLILQKKMEGEEIQDYPIFLAVSKKGGKKAGGRPQYKIDPEGKPYMDAEGNPVLDSDLSLISDAFMTGVIPSEIESQCITERFSELKDRLDPRYYIGHGELRLKALRKAGYEIKKLGDIAKYVRRGRGIDPTKQPREVFRYIEISDINLFGDIESFSDIQGFEAPSRARLLVKEGDIITAMSGSGTGDPDRHRTALIGKELDGAVVSTGFGILRPKKGVDPLILYALLRSDHVLGEIRRKLQGGGIPKVTKEDLMEIEVPLPNPGEQSRIKTEMQEFLQARQQARASMEDTQQQINALFIPSQREGQPR